MTKESTTSTDLRVFDQLLSAYNFPLISLEAFKNVIKKEERVERVPSRKSISTDLSFQESQTVKAVLCVCDAFKVLVVCVCVTVQGDGDSGVLEGLQVTVCPEVPEAGGLPGQPEAHSAARAGTTGAAAG